MAGNERSGRHKLSIGHHAETENYRPGKHGPIPDGAEGEPTMPRGLPKRAQAHWREIVPDLISRGMAKAIDTPALVRLCRLHGYASECEDALDVCAADRELSLTYRGYIASYNATGKFYGLTWGQRQKLRVLPREKPDGGVASRQRSG